MSSVSKRHNVGKCTEFYMGYIRFNATFNGNNVECFKKSSTTVFQMLPCGECYENDYT
jgi:hypothetical protein